MQLHVLSAHQVVTHDAVSAFVAGPNFVAFCRLAADTAAPTQPVPDRVLEEARSCAAFLLIDLAVLARVAVGGGAKSLENAPEHDPVSLAADLGSLLTVALAGRPDAESARQMADAVRRLQRALRKRNGEAAAA